MKKKSSKNRINGTLSSNNVVLISKELNFEPQSGDLISNIEIINLRHPRTRECAQFLYNSNDGTIQELWKYSEKYRSWFIGNSVSSEGTILLSTHIDPLFLILPFLQKSNKFRVFDELIHDEDFTDSAKLECLVNEEQLSLVADKKDCSGFIVWRYNENKTLEWLAEKTNKVAAVLKSKHINVNTSCAVSKTYIKSTTEADHHYSRYSHGVVSEYLDPELSAGLLTHLKLPPVEETTKKRKTEALSKDEVKRIKQECREKEVYETEVANSAKTGKVAKKNPKQAALAKAATGSKNISSFFKKK